MDANEYCGCQSWPPFTNRVLELRDDGTHHPDCDGTGKPTGFTRTKSAPRTQYLVMRRDECPMCKGCKLDTTRLSDGALKAVRDRATLVPIVLKDNETLAELTCKTCRGDGYVQDEVPVQLLRKACPELFQCEK